jgi:hypothetical protein
MEKLDEFFNNTHNGKQKALFEKFVIINYTDEMLNRFRYYFNENGQIEIGLKHGITISPHQENPIKSKFKDLFPR